MLTDSLFAYATYNTAQIMAGQGIPVYQYVFSRASPYTFVFCSTCIESNKYTLYQAGIE